MARITCAAFEEAVSDLGEVGAVGPSTQSSQLTERDVGVPGVRPVRCSVQRASSPSLGEVRLLRPPY